jgi:glycosyltransferase involved in cell wall biosynthesis
VRILLISNLFPPDYDGGYEMNAWKVAHGLRDRGHEVSVLTSLYRPGFEGAKEDPEWVFRVLENRPHLPAPTWKMPWVRLPMLRDLIYRESVAWVNVPRVRRFLESRSFDLAYVFGLHDVGLGCAYEPQRLGIPVLWHFGDHFLADHQGRYTYSSLFNLTGNTVLRSVRCREALIKVSWAAFVSRALQDYFAERGVVARRSFVVPRGVEFPVWDGSARELDEPPVFLMASRISKDKGIHVAVEAARLLALRRPELEWEMHVAGSGDDAYLSELRAAASERVRFLGRLSRPETLDRMRRATAFISASVWSEPFANTIIEALACGTPLIGSEVGSIFEVVESRKSALTYPAESAEELSLRMEALLESATLRESLSREGAAVIRERYTLDKILDLTLDVMNAVVHEAG